MKPLKKLKPLLDISPHRQHKRFEQQNPTMKLLVQTLSDLSIQMKNMNEKMLGMNHPEINKELKQRVFNYDQTNIRGDNQNFNRREPRFQNVDIQIPSIQTFSGPNRENKIKQWLGIACKDIFTIAFDIFHNQLIGSRRLKTYCSENLLRNIIKLVKVNNFTGKQICIINECLKNDLIPYFSLKYPLTQEAEVTIRFARQIVQKNNLDQADNDQVFRSQVKFQKANTENYNSQIMKFLNYIIQLPNTNIQNLKIDGDKGEEEKSLSDQFFEDMHNIFKMIQSKDKMMKMKLFDSKNPHANQILRGQKDSLQGKQAQKDHDYQQKVKGYTDYLIGRKISENTQIFSQGQCKAGNIKLANPAIMRIVTKWCESLLNNFDEGYLLAKQSQFRMQNGGLRSLKVSELYFLTHFLKYQKRKIDQYIGSVMKNNYQQQSQYIKVEINQNLKMFSNEQAMVGHFASVMVGNNENYLVGYINIIIHSIMCGVDNFRKYLLIKQTNSEPCEIIFKKFSYKEIQIDEVIKTVTQNYKTLDEADASADFSYKIPQLITFKIGDLLRCKCSSHQNQILALYKEIERLSSIQPNYLRIVRLKNRLEKGTKDILLNLMYRETTLIQMQLSIKTQTSKFIKNSNKFSHYLYELQRAEFGPLSQLCNIWVNGDKRSKFYVDHFHKNNVRNINKIKSIQNGKLRCCWLEKNQIPLNLPFKCDQCTFYFSDCNYVTPHLECIQCNKKICVQCHLETIGYKQIRKILPELPPITTDKTTNINIGGDQDKKQIQQEPEICTEIPESGLILDLKSKKVDPKYFKKYIEDEVMYLFQKNDSHSGENIRIPSIKQIAKINNKSKQQIINFTNQHIIFKHPNFSQKCPKITQQIATLEYFIPNYLKKTHSTHNESLTLMEKNINQQIFQFFPKQFIFQHVRKINFIGNQMQTLSQFCLHFPNLNTAIISSNRLTQIPKEIEKWGNALETLLVKKNNIERIDKNIGKLENIVRLQIHSNTDLAEIPVEIGQLRSLNYLNIGNNKLVSLPITIGDLINLKQLIMGGNQIQQVPEEIGKLENLKELSLDNNQLKKLPESISGLIKLQKLFLYNNQIQALPQNIGKLTKLKYLNGFKNRIQFLPKGFGNLISLEDLRLEQNCLKQLPQDFGNLKSLKKLILFLNKIKKLPQNFGQLKNLIQCDIFHNSLEQIPSNLDLMQSLKMLNLTKNKIKYLPNSIQMLSNLTQLSISNNQLTQLPEQFTNLVNLQSLILFGNKIQKLPQSIQKLTKLQSIDLTSNHLSQIPQSFNMLKNLQYLFLSSNKFTNFPQAICLNKIKQLQLDDNQISKIPSLISRMVNLQLISLNNNKLQQVPELFSKLPNLEKLYLSQNNLSQFTDSISNLKSLISLKLNKNKISEISPNISKLVNLKSFDISSNQLSKIPNTISNLKNLAYLNLSENSFTEFPMEVLQLEALRQLHLQKNDIVSLSRDIMILGNKLVFFGIDQKKLDVESKIFANEIQMLMRRNR